MLNVKQKTLTLASHRQTEENTHGTVLRVNKRDGQSPPKHDLTNEEKHSGMSEASHERNLRQQRLY